MSETTVGSRGSKQGRETKKRALGDDFFIAKGTPFPIALRSA